MQAPADTFPVSNIWIKSKMWLNLRNKMKRKVNVVTCTVLAHQFFSINARASQLIEDGVGVVVLVHVQNRKLFPNVKGENQLNFYFWAT